MRGAGGSSAPSGAAAATTWFVDGALGNDANSCTSPGVGACQTIQAAINKASSGDTIVVGAYGEDSNATGVNGNQTSNSATDSGAAYVFVREGTNWSQQAYLKASNTGKGANFAGYF